MTEVRVTNATGGAKGKKPEQYALIPHKPLSELAKLYGFGIEKYPASEDGIDNWRKGYDWSLSFSAMMRHAWAFWNGEDFDEESGVSHLTNVAWHAFAMREWMETHPELDDRPGTKERRAAQNNWSPPNASRTPPKRRKGRLATWVQKLRKGPAE